MTELQEYKPQQTGLQVSDFKEGMRLAELMSQAKLVPDHLQNSAADCLLVIEQASRWQMSPFAVAQATSIVRGKLMFEGKLIAAVVNSSGKLKGSLRYDYSNNNTTITVSGQLESENKTRTIEVDLNSVKTDNGQWKKNPQQMLAYAGARIWARRHTPEIIYGVYCPEEMPADVDQVREIKDVTPQEQMSSMGFKPKTDPKKDVSKLEFEEFALQIREAQTAEDISMIGKKANKSLSSEMVKDLKVIAEKRKEELNQTKETTQLEQEVLV